MQRQHDPGLRHKAPKDGQNFGPDAVKTMQMHHIRAKAAQQPIQGCDPVGSVLPQHRKPVIAAGPQQVVGPLHPQRSRRVVGALQRGGRGQEPDADPGHGIKSGCQVMGQKFRPAAGIGRVIMGDLQDLEGHSRSFPIRVNSVSARAAANAPGIVAGPKR